MGKIFVATTRCVVSKARVTRERNDNENDKRRLQRQRQTLPSSSTTRSYVSLTFRPYQTRFDSQTDVALSLASELNAHWLLLLCYYSRVFVCISVLFCESTMSLEQDLTVLFIEMVRSRPCLYDLANPHYKDTAVIK